MISYHILPRLAGLLDCLGFGHLPICDGESVRVIDSSPTTTVHADVPAGRPPTREPVPSSEILESPATATGSSDSPSIRSKQSLNSLRTVRSYLTRFARARRGHRSTPRSTFQLLRRWMKADQIIANRALRSATRPGKCCFDGQIWALRVNAAGLWNRACHNTLTQNEPGLAQEAFNKL